MGLEDPSRSWQQLSYFRRIAGHRTVPIEVGSSYLEDDWGQQLMTMNEFIDRFLEKPGEFQEGDQPVGYLAQHHLFEQVRRLPPPPEISHEGGPHAYDFIDVDSGTAKGHHDA
jgi:hypothetical protein